jgi:hypothetical protein
MNDVAEGQVSRIDEHTDFLMCFADRSLDHRVPCLQVARGRGAPERQLFRQVLPTYVGSGLLWAGSPGPRESVTSALPGTLLMEAGTSGAVARKPWREAGTRSEDWLKTGKQVHSFLATSGPVMRASSGKVAAMIPRDTTIPPAVSR